MSTLEERLELIKKHLGVTSYGQLAARAKMKTGTITYAVRTSKENPDYEMKEKTAKTLAATVGTSPEWVAKGRGKPNFKTVATVTEVEREGASRTPHDDEATYVSALFDVFREPAFEGLSHEVFDAARATLAENFHSIDPNADPLVFSRSVLNAARQLNKEGIALLPNFILARAASGRPVTSLEVAEDEDKDTHENWVAGAEERGFEAVGDPVGEAIARAERKKRART